MASTIITKHSTTPGAAPTAGQLSTGELALNVSDRRLYTKNNVGEVVEVGSGTAILYRDNFTGDGVTVAFTLPRTPLNEELVDVYINGLYQNKDTWALSGATITFTEAPVAPDSGTGNIEVLTWQSAPIGETTSNLVEYTPAGTGAVATNVQSKLREFVSVKDFGAVGNGVANDTAAINAALAASTGVFFPPGTYMTDGGHNIQGRSLIGFNRDVSIIKARGSNSGVTIFTGARNNPSSPGAWGSGGAFRLENLGIHGNWNGTSGLTVVGSYNTGVLAANYNTTLNTALVKGVSTVYTFIKNCQFAYAYEHAVMFYGNGYSEIDGNIFTTCRGSAVWFAGDKTNPATIASSTTTSTTLEDNQITTCRGGNGALIMFLTYGCTVRGNLFEANVYGYNAAEGADCSFSGNYSELGYIVGDNVGIAPVLVSPDVWGYSFVGEAYNPLGNYLPAAPRSAVQIDRSGVRIAGTSGYGGVGIQFPATQAPSTDANALDDYREGTFTPTGNGITFSSASGTFIKVGRLVYVTFTVVLPTTADGSAFRVEGLPYTPDVNAGVTLGNTGYAPGLIAVVLSGNQYAQFTNLAGSAFITNANLSAQTVVGTVQYTTAN